MKRGTDLPIHFRTGLRAVGIIAGRPVWPICGGDESEDAAAQAAAKVAADAAAAKAAADAEASRDKGFPENTAIEQMKPEQREAYWKHQARKHEDRNKAFGGLTPEAIAELQAKAKKHDEMELELGTTAEKAAAKAAAEAKAAAQAETLPVLINAKLDAAAARAGVTEEDLAKAVEFIDTRKFLAADGSVDTDKVKTFVGTITPAKGTQRVGPSSGGTGRTGTGASAGGSSVAAGREMFADRHKKTTTS